MRHALDAFEAVLRREVIEPLWDYEPLRVGREDIKTEMECRNVQWYHDDPWWLIAGVTGPNAPSTAILRNPKRAETISEPGRFPRAFHHYHRQKNSWCYSRHRALLWCLQVPIGNLY